MKKNIKITAIVGTTLLSSLAQAQNIGNSSLELTANIDAGCFITADNINFGVLQMPLSTQQANGTINLLCSNNTPLKLEVTYGSGSVSSIGNMTYTLYSSNPNGEWYTIKKNGIVYSNSQTHNATFGCSKNGGGSGSGDGKVYFYSNEFMKDIGIESSYKTLQYYNDQWNLCKNNMINPSGLVFNGIGSGSLKGITNGEVIKFEIKNPQKQNSTWGTGDNGYEMQATGMEQSLIMIAQISSDNPKHRMSPDNYQGTLNVVLNY